MKTLVLAMALVVGLSGAQLMAGEGCPKAAAEAKQCEGKDQTACAEKKKETASTEKKKDVTSAGKKGCPEGGCGAAKGEKTAKAE